MDKTLEEAIKYADATSKIEDLNMTKEELKEIKKEIKQENEEFKEDVIKIIKEDKNGQTK